MNAIERFETLVTGLRFGTQNKAVYAHEDCARLLVCKTGTLAAFNCDYSRKWHLVGVYSHDVPIAQVLRDWRELRAELRQRGDETRDAMKNLAGRAIG
jgi:hypothetical protein